MKNAIKLLSICLLFLISACDKDEDKLDTNTLPGKWKLMESYVVTGGYGDWRQQNSDLIVEFKDDGTLAGNAYAAYVSYTRKDSHVLIFKAADGAEQEYNYELRDGKLRLSPNGPIMCIEGCGQGFVKVK